MKKYLILFLITIIALSGCFKKSLKSAFDEKYEEYSKSKDLKTGSLNGDKFIAPLSPEDNKLVITVSNDFDNNDEEFILLHEKTSELISTFNSIYLFKDKISTDNNASIFCYFETEDCSEYNIDIEYVKIMFEEINLDITKYGYPSLDW